MKRAVVGICAALMAVGCTRPEPPAPVPAQGRLEYRGRYLPPGSAQPHEFRGWLVVADVTRERITGHWEVPGFERDVQLGAFVNGAYDVGASVSHNGLLGEFKHRLTRGAGGAWTCTGVFVARLDGAPVSNPATCVVTAPAGG